MDIILSSSLMVGSLLCVGVLSLFIRFGCCCSRTSCDCMKKNKGYKITYDI